MISARSLTLLAVCGLLLATGCAGPQTRHLLVVPNPTSAGMEHAPLLSEQAALAVAERISSPRGFAGKAALPCLVLMTPSTTETRPQLRQFALDQGYRQIVYVWMADLGDPDGGTPSGGIVFYDPQTDGEEVVYSSRREGGGVAASITPEDLQRARQVASRWLDVLGDGN
jgi:hypothetical protein